jgi:ATP-dependent Lon protease
MFDFLENIDTEMNDGGARVVPIITEIHEVNDGTDIHDSKADDIPILPLRNMVLFPMMTMPVSVGRDKSMRLIKETEESHGSIAVFCQYDSHVEDPAEKDLYRYGTIATIIKVLELPDGSTNVILQGRSACQLDHVSQTAPYMRGAVTLVEDKLPLAGDKEFEILMQSIAEVTLRMLRNMGQNGRDLAFAMKNIDNPVYLMNFLATNIAFDPDQKQHMLEERDVKKRGYLLYALLMREEQLVEIKANIQSRTREELSQQQRDHFLQQQIRTIQEELGTDIDDIDELQERASKMKWNEDVQKHFEKELRKLERLNPQSPDYSVQYAYLDNMLNLPWDTYTEDNFDLKKVEEKLNADHYGLAYDAMADDDFVDAFDCSNCADVSVVESAAGLDLETVFAGKDRHVFKGGNFAFHFFGASERAAGCILAGIEFHEVGTDFLGSLDLFGFCINKHAYRNVVVLERHDRLYEVICLGGNVQAVFG